MITPFPQDLLAMLDGEWATAKGALKSGLASVNAGQAGYGRFDRDIVVPAGTLTYKTGVWSPVDVSGANLVLTNPLPSPRRYVRIGRLVWIAGAVGVPLTVSAATLAIGGLPFTPAGDLSINGAYENSGLSVAYTDQGTPFTLALSGAAVALQIAFYSGVVATNANFSGKQFHFSGWYLAAS